MFGCDEVSGPIGLRVVGLALRRPLVTIAISNFVCFVTLVVRWGGVDSAPRISVYCCFCHDDTRGLMITRMCWDSVNCLSAWGVKRSIGPPEECKCKLNSALSTISCPLSQTWFEKIFQKKKKLGRDFYSSLQWLKEALNYCVSPNWMNWIFALFCMPSCRH